MKQIALPIVTRPAPGFDSYRAGPNLLAWRQLQALVEQASDPQRPAVVAASPAPWYLWGPSGTGKTHLLRALAAEFVQRGAALAWFGRDDTAPWSLPSNAGAGETSSDGSAEPPLPPTALIVLDGCDAFDAAQQQAAFSLFVEAAEAAGPRRCVVAASGRLPPVDLPLREDLRTRLGWGHVLALEPLSEADTRLVLRDAARARGLALADDVTNHLLTHCTRDLKHLMAQLDRLDVAALERRRAISLPMLRQLLADDTVQR